MIDEFDFLRDLLLEYADNRRAYPAIDAHPRWPGLRAADRIERNIWRAVRDKVYPLTEAKRWWDRFAATAGPEERFLGLRLLLDFLDRRYSDLPPAESPDGMFILGAVWWNWYGRKAAENGRGPLDKAKSQREWPFPHLRVVRPGPGAPPGAPRYKCVWPLVDPTVFGPALLSPVLRFGLCSLSGTAKTWFDPRPVLDQEAGVIGFAATRIACDDADPGRAKEAYLDELRRCVWWAVETQVHVLCLPELCACEAGRRVVREEIERDPGSLCLVVPGTFHDPAAAAATTADPPGADPGPGPAAEAVAVDSLCLNAAPIWVVGAGNRVEQVALFRKVEPFNAPVDHLDGVDVLRDVRAAAVAQHMTHVEEYIEPGTDLCFIETPVGVFGIAVCKDVKLGDFMTDNARVADHLLIPSMNGNASALFVQTGLTLAQNFCVASYYVNAMQVVPPERERVKVCAAFSVFPPVGKVVEDQIYYRGQRAADIHHVTAKVIGDTGFVCVAVPFPEQNANSDDGRKGTAPESGA